MKKRLIFKILLIFIPLSLSSCSIKIKTITSGDYKYQIYKKDKKKVAEIVGLSDIGMEKKVIIIPKYIDGYQVCELINRYRPSAPVIIGEPYTKRIFITFKLVEFNNQSIVNQNVLFIGDGLLNAERYGCFNYHAFLPYNVDLSKEHHENVRVNHANITYMVDDEIYWIDTCENGPIDYIPVEPKKDGYKFLGWYKDKEFLNKWDFAYDIVPPSKKITHEVDSPSEWTEIVYEEVMLYAKFDLLLRFIKYQN